VAARGPLPALTLVALAGCAGAADTAVDPGFLVAAVVPEDGDDDVVRSVNPALRVNASADPATCTTDTVRLVRVTAGDAVASEVECTLSFPDDGLKIKLDPVGGLTSGYGYMLTVRSGTSGCTDTDRRVVRPFASRFFVP